MLNFSYAYAIARLSCKNKKTISVVCCSDRNAQKLTEILQILIGSTKNIAYLPSPQTLLYEKLEPSANITASRLSVLFAWQMQKVDIIVMSVNTYTRALPNPDYLMQTCLEFKTGEVINPRVVREQAVRWGYEFADFVCDPGMFAVRGSIIDIFPFNSEHAFRIELFDNTIDSIYKIKGQQLLSVQAISVFPAKEYELNQITIKNFQDNWQKNFGLRGHKSEIYKRVVKGANYSGMHSWYPWFYNGQCFWHNYQQADIAYFEPGYDKAYNEQKLWARKFFEANNSNTYEPILPVETILSDIEKVSNWPVMPPSQKDIAKLELFQSKHDAEAAAHKNSGTVLEANGDLYTWLHSNPKGYYALHSALEANEIVLGVLIASAVHKQKNHSKRKLEQNLLPELTIGNYVVHHKYGIGRLSEISIIEHAGEKYDCLVIEYAEQGKVLIPTTELDQISKFKTITSDHVKLSALGKKSWSMKQKKIMQSIQDDAVMLMQLHANRKQQKREKYANHSEKFNNFRLRFPFDDTSDQAHITNEIIKDLTQIEYPMDRLICGDVGFGKTEIALRACWIVVSNNKQVIWLAPTTVLAKQHAARLKERFLEDCFNVLEHTGKNRLTPGEKSDISKGNIDILVGTHGVLNKSIDFANLGLIIIDEEHKFGVKQKDSILMRHPQVDILSLSATPIPRSLNMAMSALRDISLLASAPPERLDVKTVVADINDCEIIKQAILRETQRGGQVYFCYNRIEKLFDMQLQIKDWFPDLIIGIVHGQMPRLEIEECMQDFGLQKLDILLCSSIIESGIDYASANTLIVYRADLFGLSQLHQLRGRVGRGKQQAFAYFLVPAEEFQTNECRNRLQALMQHSKLGSGFSLAIEDLEIRGAGNLLGKKQSGHILDIGFQHYVKLLNQAVSHIKKNPGNVIEIDKLLSTQGFSYSVDFSILIPDDYIYDPNERLRCYQELSRCNDHNAIDNVANTWAQRYGCLPLATDNLIDMAHVKLDLVSLNASTVSILDNKIIIGWDSNGLSSEQVSRIVTQPHKYILKPPANVEIIYHAKFKLAVSEFVSSIK